MNLGKVFATISKLGGAAVAALGVNTHSLSTMTLGAAYAALVHIVDSVFNSPAGQHPDA